ncbi:signal peptidase II [Arenibaculum pallidiluteum]|uniref:signal peptidase II n=1 Tax=Arenibaculum pallidiluteum TaxID=2812559 RepID=UPI001A976A81|nr:signal peptidase II [Arenibaculum pallidiluteum]
MIEAGTAGSLPRPRIAMGLAAALVCILLDQASKWWILEVVMQPPRVIEVTSFFNLVLAWNRGVSFSLFYSHHDAMPWVLSALALGIVAYLLNWLRRAERAWTALALGLVIGGALGNVIDRVRFQAVVDFLDVHAAGWHWPAFNVADAGICVGVAMLVLDGLFVRPEKS